MNNEQWLKFVGSHSGTIKNIRQSQGYWRTSSNVNNYLNLLFIYLFAYIIHICTFSNFFSYQFIILTKRILTIRKISTSLMYIDKLGDGVAITLRL